MMFIAAPFRILKNTLFSMMVILTKCLIKYTVLKNLREKLKNLSENKVVVMLSSWDESNNPKLKY